MGFPGIIDVYVKCAVLGTVERTCYEALLVCANKAACQGRDLT